MRGEKQYILLATVNTINKTLGFHDFPCDPFHKGGGGGGWEGGKK